MEVTTFARGYLALIGANVQGQGIRQAADVLAPVVPLGELLGLGFRKFLDGVPVPGNAIYTTSQALTVPAGKVWRLISAGIRIVNGVGVTAQNFSLQWRPKETTPSSVDGLPISEVLSSIAANTHATVSMRVPPFYLQAGDSVGVWLIKAGGDPSVLVQIQVEEFPG